MSIRYVRRIMKKNDTMMYGGSIDIDTLMDNKKYDHLMINDNNITQLNISKRVEIMLVPDKVDASKFKFTPTFKNNKMMEFVNSNIKLNTFLNIYNCHKKKYDSNVITKNDFINKTIEIYHMYIKSFCKDNDVLCIDDTRIGPIIIESKEHFKKRVSDIYKTIPLSDFICLQEILLSVDSMHYLMDEYDQINLANYRYTVPNEFISIKRSSEQTTVLTIYNNKKYHQINNKNVYDKMRNKLWHLFFEKENQADRLLSISFFGSYNKMTNEKNENKNREYNLAKVVINVHANYGHINKIGQIDKIFSTIEKLYNAFGSKLIIAGDFNITEENMKKYVNKTYSNFSFKCGLTEDLTKYGDERTVDFIFSSIQNIDGSPSTLSQINLSLFD